jgi:isopentenyl-diphosphate delta-isomerase
MTKVTPTSSRKDDHIRINLEQDVQSALSTGLERLHFSHNAVPEINLRDIELSSTFLGKTFSAPILISSMTGGTQFSQKLNLSLAEAAQEVGVGLGLGSQRAVLEDPSLESSFQVRNIAPDIPLYANLGVVQLNYGYDASNCQQAVDMINADALILHFNPLQEALQPEGQTDFSDLLRKLEVVCKKLTVPVIAKEVGWGISTEAAQQLIDAGVSAIDVAGAGGTSWSQVEMYRTEDQDRAAMASRFIGWGIPTAQAVAGIRGTQPNFPLIASGGLRTGTDIAKCIALGAHIGALAGPLLRAASTSTEAVYKILQLLVEELRLCMFVTGTPTIAALQQVELKKI